jgi:2'-5' RNA ligase
MKCTLPFFTVFTQINLRNSEGSIKGSKPVYAELDEVDVFPNDKFDVVVIKVKSPDLNDLNEKLQDSLEFTNKYKKYKPHVTLAYVKKDRGWKYHGEEVWKGKKFKANYLVFSSTRRGRRRSFLWRSRININNVLVFPKNLNRCFIV